MLSTRPTLTLLTLPALGNVRASSPASLAFAKFGIAIKRYFDKLSTPACGSPLAQCEFRRLFEPEVKA